MKIYQVTPDMDPETIRAQLEDPSDYHYLPLKTEDEIIEACQDAEVLIPIYEPISKRVIDALPNLKYICIGSIGFDYTDTAYAKSKGIACSNNPSYCINEVADHTLALVLGLVRQVGTYDRSVKGGAWDFMAPSIPLHRMGAMTMGLVGFGRIGREVAKRAQAFGTRVLAYDPYVDKEAMEEVGVTKASLNEIQAQAHIISLHLPSTKDSQKIIDRDFLKGTSQAPFLVNVSRGDLIEEEALQEALDKGWISGLGLDVISSEDPDLKDYPFLQDPRVLASPHAAFYSQEAILEADSNAGNFIQAFIDKDLDKIPLI